MKSNGIKSGRVKPHDQTEQRYSAAYFSIFAILPAFIVLFAVALWSGVARSRSSAAPGFIDKTNWSLQPAFLFILALLIDQSWYQHLRCWQCLPTREVLYAGNRLETNPEALADLVACMRRWRRYAVWLSVFLGVLLTTIDAGCLWHEYGLLGAPRNACSEQDFTIAFRLGQFFPPISKSLNAFVVVTAYALQGLLISYGWLAVSQLILNSFCFLGFERLSYSTKRDLSIRLNYRDKLHEFGLTDVNRAINITYVFVAVGMLLPVLSAYWNPVPDLGQWLLRILLPLILLTPFLAPITDRIRRVNEAAERARADPDPEATNDYNKQLLWPFEHTQIGYVGKIAAGIAIGEYVYLVSRNFKDLF
jgi:hypothetical protein